MSAIESDGPPSKRSGLAIVWDVVVAPRAAFAALREHMHWGWAVAVICVLGLIGGYLQVPAGEHVATATFHRMLTDDPGMAALPADQKQRALESARVSQRYAWLAFPLVALVASFIVSGVFLIANAVAKGDGTFRRFFSLAANVAIVNYGIGYVLVGVLSTLRGPEAFSTPQDIVTLLPSLAWLAPNGSPKLVTLLAVFNPLQLWSFWLLALGARVVARLPRGAAYAAAAVATFGSALFPASLAR